MARQTIIPDELETLLRDQFPQHADALADCWSRYMGTWIEEYFTKKRPLNPDTVLRDGALLILLFLTKNKFTLPHDRACYVVTEACKHDHDDMVPLAPLEIEALALDHATLLADMQNIVRAG